MGFRKVRKNWDTYLMISIENAALLIAGPFHENTIKMIDLYKEKFKIIISTYENSDDKLQQFENDLNVTIVKKSLPSVKDLHNSQNIYFQCFSVLNGLEVCDKEYVVKLRSDEYYSNIDKLIEKLPADKISTSNVFIRDVSYKPFHLSDHMIVGGVEMIRNTYKDLKSYIEKNQDNLQILNSTTPAETKIFLFAFFNCVGSCKLDWYSMSEKEIFELMKRYFNIFDVNLLLPYSIKSSVVGEIKNYKQFVLLDKNLYLRYANKIEDLEQKSFLSNLIFRIIYKIKKLLIK